MMQSMSSCLSFLLTAPIPSILVSAKNSHFDRLHLLSTTTANKDSLPDVSPKQLKKLKQLTIVTLAKQSKVVPYATLQENLAIENLRELEDLVIESIYAVRRKAHFWQSNSNPLFCAGTPSRQTRSEGRVS
jgi:hypothetical protein